MPEINEETYRRLKRDVDDARSEAERAKGALDQLMTRLKEEFDCSSLKEAKSVLAKMQTTRDTAQQKFTKALEDYQRKWNDESGERSGED